MFTLLPVLAAALLGRVDRSAQSRLRKLELYLIYLFGLGVAGSGLGGFFGHMFLSDVVAESIGWPTGSPFQLEMGFANLALGVLGLIATGRRDGFREATVTAVAVVGVGATVVHLLDIVQTGNLAPGNTVQNVANLVRPALLVLLLRASRKKEATGGSSALAADFSRWRGRHGQAVGWLTAAVSTGFAVGFAVGRPVLITALGILVGAGIVALLIRRGSPA
jgi:hypothetical protein